jgi:membrane protein
MSGSRLVGNFGKEIYRTYIVEMPNNFAASLSYYSLFSLVPTIYIGFLIAGIFIDDKAAMQYIFTRVENVLGADVAKLLMQALEGISQDPSSRAIIDLVVSSFAILLSASLVFFKLQYALNTIWKIPPATKGQTKIFLLNRLISFVMVFCVGILLLVITLSYVLISFFDSLLQLQLSIPFLNLGTNWVIYTAAIALVFKLLPDARIRWKDAVIGAGVTALLLSAGSKMLGWYLAKGSVGSAFEAAGTVAVLLIAIYFLAQFFIFGTVFTRVFAEFYGGGIRPRKAVEP